jgi:hypothetical protein
MIIINPKFIFILISSFTFSIISNAQNKVTAFLTNKNLVIDGKENDDAWKEVKYTSSFWQWRPSDSILAKTQTKFKVLMDENNIYFLIKAYTDGDRFLIPSLKRDFNWNSDYVNILLDTFNDATNAFTFSSNPLGVQSEGLISGGNTNWRSDRNYSWDTIWEVESDISKNYFITEFKIPFKSLYYENNSNKWRFNIYRRNTEGNEHSTWIKTPQNLIIGNLAYMGDLKFEKTLKNSKKPFSFIPYLNGLVSNNNIENTSNKSLLYGADFKIPIGNSINLDLTFNPDFSQVEVDDQVVNLTRFEISLPEKRQFFTENSDLFSDFGNARDGLPFFSRRIGVAKDLEGNAIENRITSGLRLSGKINKNLRIGFLNMISEADVKNNIPSNLNSLITLRQKVFNRSNISLFFIDRRTTKDYDFVSLEEKANSVLGLEYNLASKDSKWTGRTFIHKSYKSDNKKDISTGFTINKNSRKNSFRFHSIYAGDNFQSDLGYYRRTGFLKIQPSYTYKIYPKNEKIINYEFEQQYAVVYKPTKDFLITDEVHTSKIEIRYLDQSNLEFEMKRWYQFLEESFDPTRSGGIPLPENESFRYTDYEISYRSDGRKLLSFNNKVSYGTFYNGKKFSINNELSWRNQPYFRFSLKLNYNKIILPNPYSDGKLWLISPKLDFTFTKKFFWTSYIQFNSQNDNFGINSKIQWRFAPLSDLFFVYNDNYLAENDFIPRYRSFNIKLTYWLNL